MWYIITAVVATGAAFLTGWVGCANHSKTVGENISQTPLDTIKGLFSRQQIKEKLEVLASTPAPENLKNGAMCYKIAAPPNRTEYICPVCGERTVHTDNTARFIERELTVCRTLADSISGIDLVLDEKQFCKKCSPKTEDPSLCIHLKFAGDTTTNTVCSVYSEDMQLLYEFTKGKLMHKDDYDNETPLKNYSVRLRELLGIKAE
jgi:hypothetical protein